MSYKYYTKHGVLLAEADSPIKFNLALFPAFKDIEPKVEGQKPNLKKTFYSKEKEEE